MMDIKRIVLSAICVGLATAGWTRETFYWTGGSGNWSNVSSWSMDENGATPATRYPGAVTNTIDGVDYSATDDIVLFRPTATGMITLDVSVSIWRFAFEAASADTSMTFESNAENPCTLTLTTTTGQSIGDDTSIQGHRIVTFRNIAIKGKSFDFRGGKGIFDSGANINLEAIIAWQNGCLIRYLDGCTVKAKLHAQNQYGTHQIEGGQISGSFAPASLYTTLRIMGGTCNFQYGVVLSKGSTLDISGGVISMSSLSVPSNATAVISGGDITSSAMPSLDANATFVFTNGTFTVTASDTVTDSRLLGTGDAVFVDTYNNGSAIIPAAEDGETIAFNHVQLTNGTASAFRLTNSVTVSGNRLDASRLVIAAAKDVTLDLKRLNLGTYLYPTVNNATLSALNGITFGAFGDWTVYDKTFSLNLGGDVTFDTTDCFDGITPRYPTVSKIAALLGAGFTITGCGGVTMAFSSVPLILPRLTVDDGASLTYVNNSGALVVDDLKMGAGSTLNLKCNMGTLDAVNASIDPTASISVQVNANLSNAVYPVLSSPDDETAAALAARTTLTGAGAEDFSIRSGAHCVYLASGEEPTYGETGASNIWTGAVNGDWNVAGNWTSGTVPYSSSRVTSGVGNAAYFGGTRNMDVTNTISGTTYLTRMAFLSSCGPLRISRGKLYFGSNGYENKDTSPIYSFSSFPVIIDSDVQTQNALSVVDSRDSYIALNGTTTISGFFRPSGEIRVGGKLTCGSGVLMKSRSGSGRSTKVHVLNGGEIVATLQKTNLCTSSTRYVVDGGGKMVFKAGTGSVHGHYTTVNTALVNGDIDFQCPYFSSRVQRYYGTGTVHFASVQSHTFGSSSIIFGGGLTIKPKSWTTVTANAPDNYIKIAVTNSAILSAAANWTYGPEAGVATTTTAAERALDIAPRATLTVKTDGYTVSFADPIVGGGNLVIEDGSKVALAGDLFASAKDDWTTFATVGSFTAAPGTLPENYRVHTVDNGDGTVSVQAKLILGLMFTIR